MPYKRKIIENQLIELDRRIKILMGEDKMPQPKFGETKEKFITRFMDSTYTKYDFPDESQRFNAALLVWKRNPNK